jgi:hypothetical protein
MQLGSTMPRLAAAQQQQQSLQQPQQQQTGSANLWDSSKYACTFSSPALLLLLLLLLEPACQRHVLLYHIMVCVLASGAAEQTRPRPLTHPYFSSFLL